MPLYDYQCRKCDNVYEEFCSYKDRKRKKCKLCGGTMNMLFSAPNIHLFKPFSLDVSPMESIRVETKGELKRVCKEHGKYAPGYDILEHSKEM